MSMRPTGVSLKPSLGIERVILNDSFVLSLFSMPSTSVIAIVTFVGKSGGINALPVGGENSLITGRVGGGGITRI